MLHEKSILSLGWYHVFTTTSVHQHQGSKIQIQTILNRVEKQKGFVYSKASFDRKPATISAPWAGGMLALLPSLTTRSIAKSNVLKGSD
jgi:hypothetical protein